MPYSGCERLFTLSDYLKSSNLQCRPHLQPLSFVRRGEHCSGYKYFFRGYNLRELQSSSMQVLPPLTKGRAGEGLARMDDFRSTLKTFHTTSYSVGTGAPFSTMGSVKEKTVCGTSLSSRISPPWARTIWRQIYNPNPKPDRYWFRSPLV
jgi:hypothetical protein